MVIRYFIIVSFISISFFTQAQEFEFKQPERLTAINTEAEETMPMLTPDGSRLYFTRALYEGNEGGKYAGLDIWSSDFQNKSWRPANNNININDRKNNVLIGMSRDAKTMYYMDASPTEKMFGIYSSKIINAYWSNPEFISIPGIDNQDFIGLYMSPDADVLFLSMKKSDGYGEEDIYFSVKSTTGVWSEPRNIGATINTSGYEISPFLSSDKKRLYFSSNGHSGNGDADIFYSERLYNSWETWSAPVNLGPVVNSKKFDAYFSIYGDTVAYFASNRDARFSDIYKVKISQYETILAKGQQYASKAELDAFIGKNVNRTITFDKKSTKLNASQKELLFYIANKLMLNRDIRFHLVMREVEDASLTKARLEALSSYLREVGIDPMRVNIEQIDQPKKSQKAIVEIMFYK